ncbi:MFS transporter [Streptosporangium sp. NPDC000396]|uniref:MFS transporter n=1 Tax=Streptosporangium sp. NPDC000396 TaxID=3366185 RepID=UPI0036BD1EA0
MSHTLSPVSAPQVASPPRLLLPVVMSATFMTSLDFFIVNVAVPSIQRDLGAGDSAIQWVVAGFGLAIAAALITAGRLGDLYGQRRVFAVGLALFTLASLACGLAPTPGILVAARVAQGVSAALITPQVLAILRTSYQGVAQARTFSLYGLIMGIGAVFGQLIGGLLIKANLFGWDWRTCFLINLPFGAAALALVGRAVPASKPAGTARLDLPGVVLITGALIALTLPIIQGREQGWPVWTWAAMAGSLVLFAAFAAYQLRLGRGGGAPLVDMSLFGERAFSAGLLAQITFWMGQASYFLILALTLQVGRGQSALESGLLFVSIGAGFMITSSRAHRLTARLGTQVISVGALVMIAGLALQYAVVDEGVWWLSPGMFVDGLGMGMAIAPLTSTVVTRVSPRHAGAAAGVLSTAQQVGAALGVALIGVVFYDALGTPVAPDRFPHAFRGSVVVLIAVELLLAILIQLLPRRSEAQE